MTTQGHPYTIPTRPTARGQGGGDNIPKGGGGHNLGRLQHSDLKGLGDIHTHQGASHDLTGGQGAGHDLTGGQGASHDLTGGQGAGHDLTGSQGAGHNPRGQEVGHDLRGGHGAGHNLRGGHGAGHNLRGQEAGHDLTGGQGPDQRGHASAIQLQHLQVFIEDFTIEFILHFDLGHIIPFVVIFIIS